MVVVLLILGIMAAVVLPAFRPPESDPIDQAADEVQHLLRASRAAALATGRTVLVSIDPVARTYRVATLADSAVPAIAEGTFALGREVSLRGTLPRARVRFDRLGLAVADSLAVVGPHGTRVIALDPWTGEPGLAARVDGGR
jgi:type II secretory pathway pseudopilin PulG